MKIVVTYDASVSAAPVDFKNAVEAAIKFYEDNFDTEITVNITLGWGEVGGDTMAEDELGVSLPVFLYLPFAGGPMTASSSPATSNLRDVWRETKPDSIDTAISVFTSVQARLHQWSGYGMYDYVINRYSDPDGYIGISSTAPINFDPANRAVAGMYDGVGILIHEISHILGRIMLQGEVNYAGTKYQPLDFFRYSAPGVHTFTAGPSYLSLNGDQLLYPFNDSSNGGTSSDWSDEVSGDVLDAFGTPGVEMKFSEIDYRIMQLLGFHVAPTATTAATAPTTPLITDAAYQLAAGQSLAFDGQWTVVIKTGSSANNSPPSFTNAGTIVNTGTKSPVDVVGVTTAYNAGGTILATGESTSVPAGWVFTNTSTGILRVTAPALAGDAVGVWWGPAVDNSGLIEVTSVTADAWGLQGNSLNNTATGIIRVQAANDAVGIYASTSNGSYTFNNAGSIAVTAHAAIAVEAGYVELNNSGTITATGTGAGSSAIALYIEYTTHWVDWSYVSNTVKINNSGLIEATDALKMNPVGTPSVIDLTNSGTIRGAITFLQTACKIRNTGSITGKIQFGNANALYDGTGGTQSGGIYLSFASNTVRLGDDGEAVYGGGGTDTVTGGSGNDFYEIARGTNTFDGGAGIDTLSLAASAAGFTVDLGTGTAVGPQTTTIRNVEQVLGSGYADTLKAGTTAATLIGGAGNDTLTGGAGNDTLVAGGGDTATGGTGNDTFIYAAGFREAGGGQLVIGDFLTGGDTLRIYGYSAPVSVAQQGADTLITLSLTDSVLLKGVDAAAVTGANVLYDAGPYTGSSLPVSMGVYGSSTIRYNRDLTITAGETLNARGVAVALSNMGDENSNYVSLDNFGSVDVTVSHGNAAALGFEGILSSYNGSLKNELGARITVTDTDAAGTAKGINAGRSPAFTNYGTFTVTGAGNAYGIFTSNDDLQTNAATGVFAVTSSGGTAYGVWSQNATKLINNGSFTVTGATAAYGVRCERVTGNYTWTNTGAMTVTATATGATPTAYFLASDSDSSFKVTFANTGTIAAAVAFQTDSVNLLLNNSGTINGDICSTDSFDAGYTDIVNTGTINGNIRFGERDSTYDGMLGSLHGIIYLSNASNTIKLGSDNGIVCGGGYMDTISGGSGDDFIAIARGFNTIDGGGGLNTVSLAASQLGYIVDLAAGTADGAGHSTLTNIQRVIGSTRDDTLKAGTDAATLIGGTGHDTLIGGAGGDTLVADGGGGDTATGNGGADTFVYTSGSGQLVITDFGNGSDTLKIYGYSAASATAQQGADVLISLSGSDSILLKNIGTDQLTGHLTYDANAYGGAAAPVTLPVWTGPTGPIYVSYAMTIFAGETVNIAAALDGANRNIGIQRSDGRATDESLVDFFDNYGTFNVTSAGAQMRAFINVLAPHYNNWLHNRSGAVFNVTSTYAALTDPWGDNNFTTAIWGENVANDGLISVTSYSTAYAVYNYANSRVTLDNNNEIRVVSTAADAIGVEGALIDNSGTITATGARSATAAFLTMYRPFINSGTLIATAGDPSGSETGIECRVSKFDLSGDDVLSVVNSGTITAKTAIHNCPAVTNYGTLNGDVLCIDPTFDNYYVHNGFSLSNFGRISGNVVSRMAVSTVTNTGTITGSVTLGDGNDVYNGAGGTVGGTVAGGSGNDRLAGGASNDTFDGGAGIDTADYSAAAAGVSADLLAGTASGNGTDTLLNFENLTGSRFADTLTGNAGDNVLSGGDEHDTLTGGAGNDTLDGGSNIDVASFDGSRSAFTLTQTSTGVWQVVGPDGTDTLTNIEYAQFTDQTVRLLPGTGSTVDWNAGPVTYMSAIRDFDGNNLGSAAGWKLIGTADVNGDGTVEHILVNRQNGRWAEVGTEPDGQTYFANNGWAGDTRVVGIYIDPLVTLGEVVAGSDFDSQRRFQNDLNIENIHGVLGQNDYNHDGLQEIYFSLTDGTAYLHAYMHADGNIQYANYQNEQQVKDYLTSNGFGSATWAGWFPAAQAPLAVVAGG